MTQTAGTAPVAARQKTIKLEIAKAGAIDVDQRGAALGDEEEPGPLPGAGLPTVHW